MVKAKFAIFALVAVAILTFSFFLFTTPNKQLKTVSRTLVLPATSDQPYHRSVSLDKEYYDNFFHSAPTSTVATEPVVSGVIPHHLIAGVYLASFFNSLRNQNPPVVVLLGPNHFSTGHGFLVSSLYDWKTPYGFLTSERNIINELSNKNIIEINEEAIDEEFSIGAPIPFVKRTWPSAKVIPIIVKEKTPSSTLDKLADELKQNLPAGSLVLASVDFSHYQPYFIANFHDILSRNVLETGALNRVSKMEIDSPRSLYFLLKYNSLVGAGKFHLIAHTNSAIIADHPEWAETTSHLQGFYTLGPSKAAPETTMQFFGDIMLDRSVATAAGAKGLDYLFEKIRGAEDRFYKGVDLFMGNLEGPFAEQRIKTSKSIAFRFDPALATQLKNYNFGAVTLANNHSFDMGKSNFQFTEKTLALNGIKYCGSQYAESADLNLFLDKGDNFPEPVVFVCVENIDHEIDKTKMAEIIARAKQQARYVILQVHGGIEYRRLSSNKQRELYRSFIDEGATAVIGHHPHVVEELEVYKGKPIVYSLGNYIFDQYFSNDTQEGLSVGVVLAEGRVKELHLFPLYGVKSQVQLMFGERRDQFLNWLSENSRLEGYKIEKGIIKF
jgi:poly-gamma-glutamate synthesis protein (capsule biosynthesis protein)